jgi:hypothetical protein
VTDDEFLKKVSTDSLDLIQEFIKVKAREERRNTGNILTAQEIATLLREEVDRRDTQ